MFRICRRARSAIVIHCGGVFFLRLRSRRPAFAIVWATYLYLRMQEATWPPWRWSAPDLMIGAISTVAILATAVPMYLLDKEPRNEWTCERVADFLLILFYAMLARRVRDSRVGVRRRCK